MIQNQDHTATRSTLLEGQVALVTGASRGIGAAIALLLARNGAAVGVNYAKNRDAAQSIVDRITAEGGSGIAVQADVGDEQQIAAMVQQVSQALGPIDTLVLNAHAVRDFAIKPFTEFTWSEFEAMVSGELQGAFLACKAVIPGMIERKQGRIIGISSGLSRVPREGFSAHSTGKSGLDALMKSLALELGPLGIRVNTVAPGLIETEGSSPYTNSAAGQAQNVARYTPLRRIGQPDDVAGAVLFLASPHSGFVTGAYLPVSGGLQMT